MFGDATCESSHRIEISYLRHRRLLTPGRRTTLSWNCGGRPTGSVGLTATEHGLRLRYQFTNDNGELQVVDEHIPFARSPTNFGGARLWLTCLRCRRRVGVLYGGRHFRCRVCHGLRYQSQQQPYWQRAIEQADKLRRRVGGADGAFDGDDFPPKPKWMRWPTYNRLEARYTNLMNGWAAGALARLGLRL